MANNSIQCLTGHHGQCACTCTYMYMVCTVCTVHTRIIILGLMAHTLINYYYTSLSCTCIFRQTEDFEPFFAGKKKLLPRHTDLSFFNWDANICTSNSTPNYEVLCNNNITSVIV